MVEEVENNEPLSYAEGTLQPLMEVPAFPGHYQIEFPREQIKGETNSDVSEIEEIKPLPIPPRDTRPSGFTIPSPPRRFTPLSPRQFTSPPPPHVQPFPESSFCSWIADRTKRKELFDKLEANAPPIASQLDIYAKMKLLQLQTVKMRTDIIDMKQQMREEVQHQEQLINHFGEGLQNQQILFDGLASCLLTSIPYDELRLNAPVFFHDNASDHNMDKGIVFGSPVTKPEKDRNWTEP